MEKKKDSFFLPDKKSKGANNAEKFQDKSHFKNKQQRQEIFHNNCNSLPKNKEEKKPFDKKAYRLKKYSKKYKLEQWEEQRRKKMLLKYHKDMRNDQSCGTYKPKTFDEDFTDSNQNVGQFVKHPDLLKQDGKNNIKSQKDPYGKAKEHIMKLKQEKFEKQQEIQKMKEEKRQKIQEYKKKKQDRFKKLSKKTKKGQPVMTGRLELLLEKIQNSK